ncbi:hypothetical protein JTE90_006266 [Oedothorax gibbosus]|uniref:Uncharacterized protein n=1 Tax=Oedothorax gibbosus TaxID=931172 RepID=A0AAV6TNH5_9ARAC|nr:hypothetical protein [Wolbachia endosymbiont of Oedothorax gibbosus]KAG8173547.1 hypothetical protein JTE90_006266 [Oedothorax gibbosus]
MLTEINGTIKLVGEENDQEIQLTIPGSDYEKFKEYKNINQNGEVIEGEFYAEFMLGGEKLYITGHYGEEDAVTFSINSVNGENDTTKDPLKLNGKDEVAVEGLLKHPRKQVEELSAEITALKAQNNTKEVADLKQLLTDKETEITALKAKQAELEAKQNEVQQLTQKNKELETEKNEAEREKQNLEDAKKEAEEKQQELQTQLTEANTEKTALQTKLTQAEKEKTTLEEQLKKKGEELETANEQAEKKINELNAEVAQLRAVPNDTAAQLKDKEDKIKELEAKINQPNAEVESLKKDLQARNARVHQLEKENKELEAKNETTEQPKQSNGAKYTATVGMGLAAGLVAFTALERTVRLEMLVMIGIAVASALVVGGITYAALPSTQVNGAEAQEVNENGPKK